MADFPIKPPRGRIEFGGRWGSHLALVVPFWESSGNDAITYHTPIHPGGVRATIPGTAPVHGVGVHGPRANSPTGVDSRYELAASSFGRIITHTADQPFTIVSVIRPDLAVGDIANIFTNDGGTTNPLFYYVRQTGTVEINGAAGDPAYASATGAIVTDGSEWSVLVAAWSPELGVPRMWVNGLEIPANTSTSATTWSTESARPLWLLGRSDTRTDRQLIGDCSLHAVWNRCMEDADVKAISRDPFAVIRNPSPRYIPTHVDGADATHAHASDNVTLSQVHTLTIQETLHGHTADNATVAPSNVNLLINDATHAHTADKVTLESVVEPFQPQFPIKIYPWNVQSLDGYTFSRSGTATYVDEDGVIQTAASGVLRNSHYEGTVRTFLLEGASTNQITQSEDLGTTWAHTNATASTNAIAAPDGTTTADKLVEDATAAVQHRTNFTPSSSAGAQTFSVFLKAGERTNAGLRIGTVGLGFTWDLSTCTLAGSHTGATAIIEDYGNGWCRCSLTVASAAANDVCRINLRNAPAGDTYDGDGTSGFYVWGAQLEELGFGTSYIPTAGSSATRNADSLSVDFDPVPQAMTVYVNGVERGSAIAAGSGLLHIGAANHSTDPRFLQLSNTNGYRSVHDNGTTTSDVSLTTKPGLADTIELRATLSTTGATQLGQSINGAAESTTSAGSAATLQGTWSGTTLYLNGSNTIADGYFAFQSIKIAEGVRSMSYMRGQASTTTKNWRLRLHEVDTVIPEDASVEYAFNVEIGEPPSVGGQVVRPLEGRTESQPWSIKLVDVGSAVTSTLGDASNRAHLLNRIADISVSYDGGLTYVILATGRVSEIQLNGLAAYTVNVVDERLVERNTTIFEGSAGTTSLWIPGFVGGSYGPFENLNWFDGLTTYPYARFSEASRSSTASIVDVRPDTTDGGPLSLGRLIEDDLKADAAAGLVDVTAQVGNFDTFRLRLVGEVADREILGVAPAGVGDRFYTYRSEVFNIRKLMIVDPSDTMPTSSSDGYLYMPGSDPTEDNPLHIEATPVELLKDIYDGTYSNGVGPRYDSAALVALAFRLRGEGIGTLRWRIKATANMARWVEDNIYKPLGIVPLIKADGSLKPVKVYPTPIEVSDTEQLEDFTESNCRILDWRHAADESVNVIRGTYLVESQYNRVALTEGGKSALDLIEETEKEVEVVRDGNPFPRRVHELELNGWHTKGEAEAVLAHRGREIFEMFGYGPLYVRLMAIDAVSDAGDYVVVKHSALPAFNSARGSSRIMLVLSRTRHAAGDEYHLIDVGQKLQPLSAPTVTVQQTGSDPFHAILVGVSGFGSDWWELAIAASTTEPATDSTLWRVVATGQEAQVVVNKLKSGTTHWVRARTRSTGRVPSDWSTAVSVATDQILAPTDLRITNNRHATLVGFAWSNFNSDDRVGVDLNGTQVAVLPAGTTQYELADLTASTNYSPGVSVYHIGPFGGIGVKTAPLSFTTIALDPPLKTPGLIVVRGQGTAVKVHW